MDFLKLFPVEIIQNIFCYLSAQDLARCCCVSRSWNNIATSDILWMRLIQTDGFQDELLVPLLSEDIRNAWELYRCKLGKKKYYERRARALHNWKRKRWHEETVEGVSKVVTLGNEGFLCILFVDGLLKLYDVERRGFVQTLEIPEGAKDLLGGGFMLAVGYTGGLVLAFTLEDRLLEFNLAFISANTIGPNPGARFQLSTSIPLKAPASSPFSTSIAHVTNTVIVIQSRRPRAQGVRSYFSLKSGDEIRQEILDHDVIYYYFHKDFIFKVYRNRICCESLSGERTFEAGLDSTLVEHYMKNCLHVNDHVVILEAFYTTGDHVTRAWDWEGSFLRHAQFPPSTSIALHPSEGSLLIATQDELSLTSVKTNFHSWKSPWQPAGRGHPGGSLLSCRPLASSLACLCFTSAFALFDLSDGTPFSSWPLTNTSQTVASATCKCVSALGSSHKMTLYSFHAVGSQPVK